MLDESIKDILMAIRVSDDKHLWERAEIIHQIYHSLYDGTTRMKMKLRQELADILDCSVSLVRNCVSVIDIFPAEMREGHPDSLRFTHYVKAAQKGEQNAHAIIENILLSSDNYGGNVLPSTYVGLDDDFEVLTIEEREQVALLKIEKALKTLKNLRKNDKQSINTIAIIENAIKNLADAK